MVEVQEQALAAVEKSEAEEIVVDERCDRADDYVEQAETALVFRDGHFRAQGRVAVHVIDVVGEGGVGVVDDGVFKVTRNSFRETDVFMDQSFFKARATLVK